MEIDDMGIWMNATFQLIGQSCFRTTRAVQGDAVQKTN